MYKVGDKVIIIGYCEGHDDPIFDFGVNKGDVVVLTQVLDDNVLFYPKWVPDHMKELIPPLAWSKAGIAPLTDYSKELYFSSETE